MNNKKKKILIVEDSREIAQALASGLEGANYNTTLVSTGKECVAEVKKTEYDLILLDLVMPGMSGFEVLKEIRRLGHETPVMVLSNLEEYFTREEALKMGAMDYVEKANTPLNDIVARIQKFLNK